MTGTAMAKKAKVTLLMSKDLTENPGKEALMIVVEHVPGGSSTIHRHNAHAFVYVLEGSVVMQLKGGQEVTLMLTPLVLLMKRSVAEKGAHIGHE